MINQIKTRLGYYLYPNSLRMQLLSRLLIILALLLVLIGLFQYIFMRDVVYRNKAASLQSQVMSIPPPAWEFFNNDQEMVSPDRPLVFVHEAALAFIDANGQYSLLLRGRDGVKPPQLQPYEYKAALNEQPAPHYHVTSTGGVEQLVVLRPVRSFTGEAAGVIEISTPTGPLKELLIHQLLTFLFLALSAMIFGLLCFLPVINKTLAPLSRMVDTAEQIDAGNLDRRFPTRQGQVEIDSLADSCNGMLERLEASFAAEIETKEQMRRFIADASHELRTPLTSINGFLEILLRGAVNQPEQLDKSLKSMYSESQRLTKLVHDLLLLTRLDRQPHPVLTEAALDRVLKDMEEQLRILAGKRKFDLTVEENVAAKIDTDQIKQVVLNLFQNAVQHTDAFQGEIQVSLVKKDQGAELAVRDNGPGISETNLPHIFERFYRSDSSRTRKYGGAGLGLSITKSIVDLHGGHIWVDSREGAGSTFHVWLPACSKRLNPESGTNIE